jgi:hypothetical protein
MKREIIDPLEKLENPQREYLLRWLTEQGDDYGFMRIAQMIEFLDTHREGWWEEWAFIQDHNRGFNTDDIRYSTGSTWVVRLSGKGDRERFTYGKELCDALWEAVIEMLDDAVEPNG